MRIIRKALLAALAIGLAGCVSLFPKAPPAQLYHFGYVAPAAGASAATGAVFNVTRMPTDFAHPADGDRILTMNGSEAAFIAGARWDAPAGTLFNAAENEAFEAAGGPARLLQAGDPAPSRFTLKLDVQSFEARYDQAAKGAGPTVVVTIHALLVDDQERKVVGDQVFESRKPTSQNRVGVIVEAYNAAVTDVLGQIVGWTGRQGAPG